MKNTNEIPNYILFKSELDVVDSYPDRVKLTLDMLINYWAENNFKNFLDLFPTEIKSEKSFNPVSKPHLESVVKRVFAKKIFNHFIETGDAVLATNEKEMEEMLNWMINAYLSDVAIDSLVSKGLIRVLSGVSENGDDMLVLTEEGKQTAKSLGLNETENK